MKSHNCHVFMQRLLPVAFRDLFPINIWNVITELSQFLRDISSTTLRVKDMIQLENVIPQIICKLEKIFPPSFFDSMEHLLVHLPYEAKVEGPVQCRWMCCFERFLYQLKKMVGNKARVEGSICNAYLTEEISNFCSHYFESNIDTKATNVGHHFDASGEKHVDPNIPEFFHDIGGYSASEGCTTYLDEKDYEVAHRYVLGNCGVLSEYERLALEKEKAEEKEIDYDAPVEPKQSTIGLGTKVWSLKLADAFLEQE